MKMSFRVLVLLLLTWCGGVWHAFAADESEVDEQRPGPPFVRLDVGTRLVAEGMPYAPSDDRLVALPVLSHVNVSRMFKGGTSLGLGLEFPTPPRSGTLPFVADFRVGIYDYQQGKPRRRSKWIRYSRVYLGWRWIHDHYRGSGGEWTGVSDAAGLVLGYITGGMVGQFDAVSESQFTGYFLGWQGRPSVPLSILNQRVSVGIEPIFIDFRLRVDPGTGEEISVGLSVQHLFKSR